MLEAGCQADLVLTDHLMPGMSGAELARHLRTHWPDLPVLVVSGHSEGQGLDADLPRLTKPYRFSDLVTAIATLTGKA